jgi:hypothetical protein
VTHELGSTSCTDKYCCSLINVIRRGQFIDPWPRSPCEEAKSAFPLSPWGLVGIAAEMAEMPERIPGCQNPTAVVLDTYLEESRSGPVLFLPPPRCQLFNHDHPNGHLAVPWGTVAYIRLAKDPRTVLPRLRLYLIFSRASRRSGVPGRLGVESRCGISANFPHRVVLFDHLAQAEGRVSGEEPWCNLSSGPCWKAARQS